MPATITYVDEELHNASHSRNWRNTCIFDIRLSRSQARRKYEDSEERRQCDDIAYEATKHMLDMLESDVVLLCQSDTRSSENDFAKVLSSSTEDHGTLSLYKLQSGKKSILVHGFHPMYVQRAEESIAKLVRQAALRFSFLQAINILEGRIIKGRGIKKLSDAPYGVAYNPPRLLSTGLLDPSLDFRFKGVFLAKEADPEFKRMWRTLMAKESAEVSQNVFFGNKNLIPESCGRIKRSAIISWQ